MNLLLLEDADFIEPGTVRITGRRFQHLHHILKTEPGQALQAGLLGGLVGRAELLFKDAQQAIFKVTLAAPPPPPPQFTLLLALPRPKVIRRLLQGVTTFGVKRIILLNTARVDKSYWQSPFLSEEGIREQLLLGLEQARDTILPEVHLRQRFRPFVEDELPLLSRDSLALVADPAGEVPCPGPVTSPTTLAIGPEGGFVPFEVDLLIRQGFRCVHLGPRALRVESAVPALLGRLIQP